MSYKEDTGSDNGTDEWDEEMQVECECESEDSEPTVNPIVNFDGTLSREAVGHRAMAEVICFSGASLESLILLGRCLNPNFHVDVDTVQENIMEVYAAEKERVKEVMRKVEGQISLSIDMLSHWGVSYMCAKVHFVDENWKLKNWVIAFRRGLYDIFPCYHVLSNTLKRDLDIVHKISSITGVKGGRDEEADKTHIGSFGRFKKGIMEKKELQLDGKLFRVLCCGEMISSMVQKAFHMIENQINQIQLLAWSKHGPYWHVKNHVLLEALKLEAMGEFSSKDVTDSYDVPTLEEWNRVKSVTGIVEKMYNVLEGVFVETRHLTANNILYCLIEIQDILVQGSTSADDFLKKVASKMLKKFDEYMNHMFLLLAIAAVLDPRFKMKYIEFISNQFKDHTGWKPQCSPVMEAIQKLFKDYATKFPVKADLNNGSVSNVADTEEQHTKVEENFHFLRDFQEFIKASSPLPKSDLERYLDEPVLPWSDNFCALSWWKVACHKYPTLSQMARDFLPIQISVAQSYEAFYMTPREIDRHTARVCGDDMKNVLSCTRSWCEKPTKNTRKD